MGIRERREREKNELRSRIMDAARELILEVGIDNVSMRKIAERIEYSPTAIYQYFPDKEALLHEMCQRDFDALGEEMREQAPAVDPVERIRLIGRTYIRFAMEYPSHFRVMFMTPISEGFKFDDEDRKRQGNPDLDGYAFFKLAIQQAIDAARFRPELTSADLIAQVLWAGVHGIATLIITHSKDPWIAWAPLEDRINLMLDALLRGMLREGRS